MNNHPACSGAILEWMEKMRVKITADSTCDLEPEQIRQHDITVTPLHIGRNNGQDFRDGVDIDPTELFRYADEDGVLCHTAAVSVGEYEAAFRKAREEADAVFHVNLGSGFSSCYQNAKIAAQEVDNVFVLDSQNLSSGMGHLVMDAAELAEAGERPEEILRILEERRSKVETSFVLSTLRYMRMGGRCSAVAALGANLLKLSPCIELRSGAMGVGKKYRGSFEKVLAQYVHDRLDGRTDIDYRRIFITDCMAGEENRMAVRKLVEELADFDVVLNTHAGCTVSNHCGPGCLGILFFRK